MARRNDAGDSPSEGSRPSPLQRLLRGAGIPMPLDCASEELALFTPEERRELSRGNAEQCEANR
ncbi:MAG TPA: hypothetical protein VFX59_31635 [Polyangiales bacterium]|nr:hypothetical protein [Polyangiales bacterium]